MPVTMTACSEADVWVHALNKRQMVAQEHESLTRTAWQNAAELYHLQATFPLQFLFFFLFEPKLASLTKKN